MSSPDHSGGLQNIRRPTMRLYKRSLYLFILTCIIFVTSITATWGQEDISRVSILATNSIDLGSSVEILSGNVVVNDASPASTLSSGKELVVYSNASTHSGVVLMADSIELKSFAVVHGDAGYNDIQIHKKAVLEGTRTTPLSLPVFNTLPLFMTATPGTLDVIVGKNGSIFLPPGDYNDVLMEKGSEIRFSGGIYSINYMEVKKDCRLLFEGPSEVRIKTTFKSTSVIFLGQADSAAVAPSEIFFYVAGINGTSGENDEEQPAVQIGSNSQIFANFYVPNGTFKCLSRTIAVGAFIARDIDIGYGCQFALDSGFTNNLPPIAQDDAFDIQQGRLFNSSASNFSLLDNDTDPDAGDILSVSTAPVVPPLNGSLVLYPDGTFIYTHDASDTVMDSFVYEVCDNGTPQACSQAEVVATITGVQTNHLPTANSQELITLNGDPVEITLTAYDPDYDHLTFSITANPSEGTLSNLTPVTPPPVTSARVTYTPNSIDNVTDRFEFQVDDGISGTDTAEVIINPEIIPEEPIIPETVVAYDNTYETDIETPLEITLTAGAPSGVFPTFSIVSHPVNGSLVLQFPEIIYTPDPGHSGQDQFEFEACGIVDQIEVCDTAVITVNTLAAPSENPPFVENQMLTTFMNTPLSILLKGSSSAPDPIEISASVAGIVADSNLDGMGDEHDALPGDFPLRVAAGVGYYADGSALDPDNDADPDPDLLSATVHSDGRVLFFEVRFKPGTFDPSSTRVKLVFDMDENPATGHPGSDAGCTNDAGIIGAEYVVDLGQNPDNKAEIMEYTGTCNIFSLVGSGYFSYHENGINAVLPLSLLGDDDGRFNFKVTSSEELPTGGNTGVLDYMPNVGQPAAQVRHVLEGVARIQVEFPLADVPLDFTDAAVVLSTYKGQFDTADTNLHIVSSDGNGILENSDFESVVSVNPAAVMSLTTNPGIPAGTVDEFSFSVSPEVKSLLSQGKNYLSIQGRSSYDAVPQIYGFIRGHQIYSSAEPNLTPNLMAPRLRIIPSGVEYTIMTLPLNGKLLDATGEQVVSTPFLINGNPMLQFIPDPGFQGSDFFEFQVNDGSQTATAIISIDVVFCDCYIYKQCCNDGR